MPQSLRLRSIGLTTTTNYQKLFNLTVKAASKFLLDFVADLQGYRNFPIGSRGLLCETFHSHNHIRPAHLKFVLRVPHDRFRDVQSSNLSVDRRLTKSEVFSSGAGASLISIQSFDDNTSFCNLHTS